MVMLAKPRPGSQPARKPGRPRLVRVRGAECPLHRLPVYLDGRRLVCPACDRWTVRN